MNISIEEYNKDWNNRFLRTKVKLKNILHNFEPQIEHIGSTAIVGLSAKPIIDVAIGLKSKQSFDLVTEIMQKNGYIYLSVFNDIMPERRFFIGLKGDSSKGFESEYSITNKIPQEALYQHKETHVHIWEYNSTEYTRHIAFRDYLREHENVRTKYQTLKLELSKKSWANGNEYNQAKNDFIKKEESKAIKWFENNRLTSHDYSLL